jgi:hypothetical protein
MNRELNPISQREPINPKRRQMSRNLTVDRCAIAQGCQLPNSDTRFMSGRFFVKLTKTRLILVFEQIAPNSARPSKHSVIGCPLTSETRLGPRGTGADYGNYDRAAALDSRRLDR